MTKGIPQEGRQEVVPKKQEIFIGHEDMLYCGTREKAGILTLWN